MLPQNFHDNGFVWERGEMLTLIVANNILFSYRIEYLFKISKVKKLVYSDHNSLFKNVLVLKHLWGYLLPKEKVITNYRTIFTLAPSA